MPGWFGGNRDFENLADGLRAHGFADADVRKVMGGELAVVLGTLLWHSGVDGCPDMRPCSLAGQDGYLSKNGVSSFGRTKLPSNIVIGMNVSRM